MFEALLTTIRGKAWEGRHFAKLDLLGAYYSDNVNDGMMGNVSAQLLVLS